MFSISKYFINPNSKLEYALKKISKSGEKFLIVVDKNKKLLGTITDGDIRRSILKNNDLTKSIKSVFNSHPIYFLKEKISREKILKILLKKKISAAPIVNKLKRVVNIIFINDLLSPKINKKKYKKKVDTCGVIMAGGKGTRLEPFTKILPKPLIPINEKAIIEHIIDCFKDHNINKIYMTVNYKSLLIKSYFKELKLKSPISFVEEKEELGTIGGIKILKNKLNKPFFVTNCDIIVKTDLSDLYEFHVKNKSEITIVASTSKLAIPYGVCKIDSSTGTLKSMLEKPVLDYLVNTGFYVLSPKILKLIPNKKKFDMTDLIDLVDNKKIYVYPIHSDDWVDIGQWPEYHKATKSLW